MSWKFNARESLQFLEEEGFFSQADIAIQPPIDGLESEEGTGYELENYANHLSGKQLLAYSHRIWWWYYFWHSWWLNKWIPWPKSGEREQTWIGRGGQ